MSLIKTQAFVIRTIRYSDTSNILTLLTRELGKISAIHKGSRKSSKTGSSGSFSHFEAMIYFKDNREIQLMSQIHSMKVFKNIVSDIDRLRVAYIVHELINKCTPVNSPNEELFESVNRFFEGIDTVFRNPELELLKFLTVFAEFLGIIPESVNQEYETFFARSGFTLCKSDLDFLVRLKEKIDTNELNGQEDVNLNKLCRFYEQLLMDNALGNGYQKTRSVFDQL
jgi:hypothetical protein